LYDHQPLFSSEDLPATTTFVRHTSHGYRTCDHKVTTFKFKPLLGKYPEKKENQQHVKQHKKGKKINLGSKSWLMCDTHA
jgi:hypothetical protein